MNLLTDFVNRYRAIKACLKNPGKQNSWTYKKYPPRCDFGGRRVLNVGCGSTVYMAPNVVNLDMFPGDGINVVWDLSKMPLPFKDGEFDFIVANHILEHVPGWWECFKELARILKVGGTMEVWLPGDGGSSQLGYRDHINVINHCSFVGVRGTVRNMANSWEKNEHETTGFVKDLEFVTPTQIYLPNWWWVNLLPSRMLTFMVDHLRNIVAEVGHTFVKRPPLSQESEYKGFKVGKKQKVRANDDR